MLEGRVDASAIDTTELDAELRADLQAFFLTLHEHGLGCRILETYNLARFVSVEHSHYDPIRNMAAQAATIRLG